MAVESPRLVQCDLPYRTDSSLWFEALRGCDWPVFLDSGGPHDPRGRHDILSADPQARIETRGEESSVLTAAGTRVSHDDPLTLLDSLLGPLRTTEPGLPFCGGAIGYFGYDLARRFMQIPEQTHDAENLPEMAVGIYTWALIVDHVEQRSRLVAPDAATLAHYRNLLLSNPAHARTGASFTLTSPIRSNLSRAHYLEALGRIRDYLHAGDCYQVNLAQRFAATCEGDPWQAYLALRQRNAAPFAAYLDFSDYQILCSSPERFLTVRDGQVETRPIKGTRPRMTDPQRDRAAIAELRSSPKEQAENLMIVDLLRNDLGKVCVPGSIRVPTLFAIESYARVHHLVSAITGTLAPEIRALDLLRGSFPGGSITGAPKLRAMQIIEELEPHRRGVYCGAIGYLGFDGAMDTNIVIRTLVHSHGCIRTWAGGGIVIDSDPEAEYQETFDKAAPLLETLRAFSHGKTSA